MQPFAYEATILGIPYRVATITGLLAAGPVGVTPLGFWPLLLAFATVFPTIIMTAYLVVLIGTKRLLLPEVCQGFRLRDGVVYSPDLPPFQLRSGLILQPIHEVEQCVVIHEVGNQKCKGGKLPHIRAYAALLSQLPHLALCFIDNVAREERLLELHTEQLSCVQRACPLCDVRLFTLPP